jgi:hypothetical protein
MTKPTCTLDCHLTWTILFVMVAMLPAVLAADEPKALIGKKPMVGGTVTLDGKPLPKGKLTLHPAKGKPIAAEIKEGAYATESPVGTMVVTIEYLGAPKVYSDPTASGLRVAVKAGKNTFDFALTSK